MFKYVLGIYRTILVYNSMIIIVYFFLFNKNDLIVFLRPLIYPFKFLSVELPSAYATFINKT